MKKEIADLWVAALRSGKYKQGQKALRPTNDTFCCLGVLCDIAPKEVGTWSNKALDEGFNYIGDIDNDEFDEDYRIGEGNEERVSLVEGGECPQAVQQWAGLNDSVGTPRGTKAVDKTLHSLATLNDDHGYTFDQIADLIERDWEKL